MFFGIKRSVVYYFKTKNMNIDLYLALSTNKVEALDNWLIIYGDFASKKLIDRVETKKYDLISFTNGVEK